MGRQGDESCKAPRENGSHETNVSFSHDSLACILLETPVGYKMDRRSLQGP